jgi:hypothetical protein
MLARPVPGLEGRLQWPLQASLRLPSNHPSPFANDQHCPAAYPCISALSVVKSRVVRSILHFRVVSVFAVKFL